MGWGIWIFLGKRGERVICQKKGGEGTDEKSEEGEEGILIEKGEAKDKEWGKRIELYGEGMFWFNY